MGWKTIGVGVLALVGAGALLIRRSVVVGVAGTPPGAPSTAPLSSADVDAAHAATLPDEDVVEAPTVEAPAPAAPSSAPAPDDDEPPATTAAARATAATAKAVVILGSPSTQNPADAATAAANGVPRNPFNTQTY